MLSYFLLPRVRPRFSGGLWLIWLVALLGLTAACGGSSPRVDVIGVASEGAHSAAPTAEEEKVVVFLEVINRTGRELELARLDYELSAQPWFETRGSLTLRRPVDADSSAVVEVPVDVGRLEKKSGDLEKADVGYEFDGRLVAREEQSERSWSVSSSGTLRAVEGETGSVAVRVGVAEAD